MNEKTACDNYFYHQKHLIKLLMILYFMVLIYQVSTMKKICLHSLKPELKQLHQRLLQLEVHELTKFQFIFSCTLIL